MRKSGIRRLLAIGLSAMLLLTVVGVAPVSACDRGCTPGYWKNHTDSWMGYSPTQTLQQAGFVIPGALADFRDDTLLQALNYGGVPGLNGAARILFRAAVASLLNAYAFNDGYHFWTPAEILWGQHPSDRFTGVNEILPSLSRSVYINYAAGLDYINNLGCPLN